MFRQAVTMTLLCLVLAACATQPRQAPATIDESSGLILSFIADHSSMVWPSPPDLPRYRYVGQLLGEQNYPKATQSLGSRFFGWLVGLGSRKHQPRALQRPQSGIVTADGRIMVTDVGRAAVFVFDRNRSNVEIWENAANKTRFVTPVGIVEGAAGRILVADADLGRIVMLDSQSGKPVGAIGNGRLRRPTGLARDPEAGLIYVADTQGHKVEVFNDDGVWQRSFGERGDGDGQFNAPTYITLHDGTLYITDTLNSRVQLFDTDGHFLRSIGRRGLYVGDMPRPKGNTVDKDGNLYVVESYYDYLLIFNNKGDFLLPIGGTGNTIGRFYLPAGIWSDRHDRIYVADTFNGRIVIFQYLGDS